MSSVDLRRRHGLVVSFQQTQNVAVRRCLRKEALDDVSGNVGQAEVAAAETVGQALVVQSHQVQNGRVEIVDVDFVFGGVPAEFV